MALRSGYKGIKKLAAGLKWNMPGILAADDTALANVFFPRSEQAVLGAYNIIDNVMVNHTENGVTFTVNADKSASLSGISTGDIAGHDSSLKNYNVCWSLTNLKKGRYKLIGCPSGGSGSTYRLIISNAATSTFVTDTGEGAVFDYDPDAVDPWVYCYIRINSGQDMTGKVFKPMITTDLNATYDDYVAPAMTNKELTDAVQTDKTTINAIITAATEAADFTAFKAAMEAITPVTRSLSKEASPEDVPEEELEEEKPVTKKTTKKTVKEGE